MSKEYQILVVDDKPENRLVAIELLKSKFDNITFIESASGGETLDKVIDYSIDLILLDVKLPDFSGFEVAKLLKSRKATHSIPIIFLTAEYTTDLFKQVGFKSGAIDYLTKPIDEEKLYQAVGQFIKQKNSVSEKSNNKSIPTTSQPTILAVDDREENLLVLRTLINAELPKVKLLESTSGREALEIVTQTPVNLIILDIHMPDMDGYEVARELKSHKLTRNIPIVFLTAVYKGEEFKNKGLQLEAVDYLTKPINDFQLLNKIKLYLKLFHRQQHLGKINQLLEQRVKEEVEKAQQLEKIKTEELKKANSKLEEEIKERKKIETLLRKRNRELARAIKKAEEADQLKSSFLANMSHEIRTPMNSILGFTDLISDSTIQAKEKEVYVQLINKAGNQLLNLINDIVDLSKIEANQIVIKEHSFNLNELLNETVALLQIQQKELAPNVELKVAYGFPNNKSDLLGDADRVKQIITNLVSNSIKFTSEGVISITYTVIDNYVQFKISDTGIGISPENQKKIFDRFIRDEKGFKQKKYGGTGLGLAICKNLVELMGGSINVTSELEKGSTFYFSFPYRT
ncbi:response regulator [Prolixibacteraceae bacterium JC049]|nr:response regulator [Prolixibacteraceae bacterium JC049]